MKNRTELVFDNVVKHIAPKVKDIGAMKALLDRYDLKGKSVLEVGCGIGDNSIYCARKKRGGAAYVEGFDVSGESINIALSKAKNMPGIFFHKCDLGDYITKRKFDLILAIGVFEYFRTPLDSLKKICGFLKDEGMLILLVSRPIFVKRISAMLRFFLARIPSRFILPMARFLKKPLWLFHRIFKDKLYISESKTYSFEQTIMEGLMVPRYNIFHHRLFTSYLDKNGFSVTFFENVSPSMVCIIAKRGEK
ncbi:MAG: class I SAM-dependent methyltransferase [Candidatus Omnitrophica bacterium]|nr:class I SAM-dependent methyltransferase [Candidatus Omnitrophota bacterium]